MMKKLGLNKLNKLMTTADKIAVVLIVLVSISLIILTPRIIANKTTGEKEVVVTLRNREIFRHKLVNSQQVKRVKFDFTVEKEQYQGTLRLKEGKVKLERLKEEISPLPIHAKMGWISKPYQVIVCLPIELTVRIEAETNSPRSKVDVHTF